ncbi:hypothetical protein NPX99_01205 [Bartonella sp. 220]|uniref:type IV secretion system protein n=1 Tax=Bartonella sp. 220B TaxID=2967260 RepID=UPI0022A9F49F|nr:type IV secretion system protein [Bartonella sp. 220B]MCZ2157909.1 hypothetical protein [Bartonella sp. 220B]
MKKTIISVVIATVFGIQSTNLRADESSLLQDSSPPTSVKDIQQEAETSHNSKQTLEVSEEEQTKLSQKERIVVLAKKQLQTIKEQFQKHDEIHRNITGNRDFYILKAVNIDAQYFKNPHSIYNKNRFDKKNLPMHAKTDIPDSAKMQESIIDQIIEQNINFLSIPEARAFIEKRSQYAAIVDKAISLQVFDEVENRSREVKKPLVDIKNIQDLKGIAELQAYVEGTNAVFQNEATKLQMVAHLRNAEQALIRQQKYKRNIQILNHKNTQMPTVKIR